MQLSHSFSSLKLYENCPLRYYNQRVIKSVVDKGGEASQYGERIHKFLEDRLKAGAPLPPEAEPIEGAVQAITRLVGNGEIHIEKELTLNQNLEPTGWWDKDAWVRSKLDVLILRSDEAFNIDWKTGKRRPDFTQLELFALQIFAHYPHIEKVTGSFVWIKDVALDKETYYKSDTPRLWEMFLSRVQRIETSLAHDNWPARPSGLCNYCPCKPTCDYAR